MLEQIAAFLLSLAVGAAGALGIQTATTTPHGVGTPEIAAAQAALARQAAAERLAEALAEALEQALVAREEGGELEAQDGEAGIAGAGLDSAVAAIASSPAAEVDAAEVGLETAVTAIENARNGNGDTEDEGNRPENVPPVTPPTAPPSDVPSGSSDAPGGRP